MKLDLKIENFEKKLLILKEQLRIPGLSVAISHNDDIVFSKGFGYSDIKNKIKTTPNTPFRIASLTKPIASVLILQLVEKGIIDLDKSIAEYIPKYLEICKKNKKRLEERKFEFDGKMISLAHLIQDYHFEKQNITVRHHLQQTIMNEPGEEYRYNGLLFTFLGIAVDFQVEEKFLGLLRKNILEKLQMNNSLPCQEDETRPEILERLAKPYRVNRQGNYTETDYPQKNGSSAAGIISTVLDYLKFDKALNRNELISEKIKELAFSNPINKKGKTLPYGLGFFVQEIPEADGKIIWHYGQWDGSFSSLYLKIPARKFTLVMFANSDRLSVNFNLHEGDIRTSPFAKNFLEIFS